MDIALCLAGQLWNKTLNACLPCPEGTWNSVPGRNEWCQSCTTCYPFSHTVYGCNNTHDNFCICDEDYFHSQFNAKICIRAVKYLLEVHKFTEGNFIVSNFSTGEQAFNSTTTNASVTTDQGCHWTAWLPAWIFPVVLVAIGLMCSVFVGLLLIYIICKKKSQDKRQQPDAAVMLDPEKNPLVEQQQGVQDEKHNLLWDQENENSIVNDAGNSPSQFDSGGSGQAGIPESCPIVGCPASVRSTAYDRAGGTSLRNEALPSSSLCEEHEDVHFSLNLREDEYQAPIKEVAEGNA